MTGLTSVTLARLPFREVARLAAEAGAECVEWSAKAHAVSVAAAKEIAEESAARGLACTGLGSYFRVGVSPARDFDELSARANALGADHIRVWLGGKSSRRTSDGEYAALLASDHGIQIRVIDFVSLYIFHIVSSFYVNDGLVRIEQVRLLSVRYQ